MRVRIETEQQFPILVGRSLRTKAESLYWEAGQQIHVESVSMTARQDGEKYTCTVSLTTGAVSLTTERSDWDVRKSAQMAIDEIRQQLFTRSSGPSASGSAG